MTASIYRPGESPAPRPAHLEDVPPQPGVRRSPRLEEELRRALPTDLRVDRISSAVISGGMGTQYEIGALITDGTGYGTILVAFDHPTITSGTPGCFPHEQKLCRILPRPDGDTVSMVDRSAEPRDRSITAERFQPDHKLVLRLRVREQADERPSRFWRGGAGLGRVPLTVEQIAVLSDHPGFVPD